MLGRSLDMVPVSSAHHYAVGVKELITSPALTKSALIWRPTKAPLVISLARPPTAFMGGGFLYTNRDRFLWGWYVARAIAHAGQKRTANAGRF